MTLRPTYHDLDVDGSVTIHYIEAGASSKPTLILLHGWPSSSTQYRNLIPLLSEKYHILAPDLPGFGLTKVPKDFKFTFDNLADAIQQWVNKLEIHSYAVYIFDYGAPVAHRLILSRPQAVKALISQNGNSYVEGFGPEFWKPIKALWESDNGKKERQFLRENILTLKSAKNRYAIGVPEEDLTLIDPIAWHSDYITNMSPESNRQEEQLDLFFDYRTNIQLYPEVHAFLRESKVPVLAVWGKGDIGFIPAGAEAYKTDSPSANVVLLDAGHFALETKVEEIASLILGFLKDVRF